MDVDSFLESIAATDVIMSPMGSRPPGRAPETIDALFHLPLLALATMVIARRTEFRTMVLGRNIAMLLIEHFAALRRSPHGLETSLTLRHRCADALAFLEATGLATISRDSRRIVALTDTGKTNLDRAARDQSDLGLLVRQLRINQERVLARNGDER
jgi:hypothetical protein